MAVDCKKLSAFFLLEAFALYLRLWRLGWKAAVLFCYGIIIFYRSAGRIFFIFSIIFLFSLEMVSGGVVEKLRMYAIVMHCSALLYLVFKYLSLN